MLTIEQLDKDGAILDAVESVHGCSRAEFLRKAAVGSGGLIAALAVAPPLSSAKSSDSALLNFDLTFEYLQSTFYTEAVRFGTVGAMDAETARWARTLGAHERAHVRVLRDILGRKAVKRPFFDFGGTTEDVQKFVKTAVAFEDLTTALLTGQVTRLNERPLVAAVFSLMTVEARHAAWARHIAGFVPVAKPLDAPKTLAQVDRIVQKSNFISKGLRTWVRQSPRFTG
jgi:hypothetical protein